MTVARSGLVRLRDGPNTWFFGFLAAVFISVGAGEVVRGEYFGAAFVVLGGFFAAGLARSFVAVSDETVEVHQLTSTRKVRLVDIVGFDIHQLGFFEGARKSVLRIRLASGDWLDVPPGVNPIGPTRFHARVAAAITERLEAQGASIAVPRELRYLLGRW